MAMSNFPSTRLVIWKTELGVGDRFTSIPLQTKNPFSWAILIGQVPMPGNAMTDNGESCCTTAVDGANRAAAVANSDALIKMDLNGDMALLRIDYSKICAGLLALLLYATAASAQTGTIRFIVGAAPGGAIDPYARIIAEHMAKTLKQTIIVEHKPGANG